MFVAVVAFRTSRSVGQLKLGLNARMQELAEG
jgi:hypothetical protein